MKETLAGYFIISIAYLPFSHFISLNSACQSFFYVVCSGTCCGYWIKIPDRAPERTAPGALNVHWKVLRWFTLGL